MKTIITTLLLFIAIVGSAQNVDRKYFVWDDNVSNKVFKQGDSSSFAVIAGPGFVANDRFTAYIFYGAVSTGKNRKDTIIDISYAQFLKLPTYGQGQRKISFKIPEDGETGAARLYIRYSGSGYLPFSIVSGGAVTSIDESFHVEQPEGEIRYFSLTGQEIQKPTEGPYIWRKSNGESGKVFIAL